MLRSLILAVFTAGLANAAIWPAQLGPHLRQSAAPAEINPPDRPLLDEYGLESAEQADYGAFKASAERFKDTTGAYAASIDPAGNGKSRVGNYLVSCEGRCPKDFLKLAGTVLPRVSAAQPPILMSYMPSKGMLPHSERYIMGPLGLHAYAPQIQESAVALQFETEGEVALYRTPRGEQTLGVFNYPTPQMARQQEHAYEAIPGAVVKRTGPFIALVVPSGQASAQAPAEARKLLDQVNYLAAVAWNEPLPLVIKPQTAAQMVLGILALAGIVLGFCLFSGLAFGAIRVIARKFGYSGADGRMTTLHIEGK